MATSDVKRDPIDAGGFPTAAQPVAGDSRRLPARLYVLSLLIAGVAILAALLAVIAAGAGLFNLAVAAVWVFIVATGLWAGGTIYILSVGGKRLWDRLRPTNNVRSTN